MSWKRTTSRGGIPSTSPLHNCQNKNKCLILRKLKLFECYEKFYFDVNGDADVPYGGIGGSGR